MKLTHAAVPLLAALAAACDGGDGYSTPPLASAASASASAARARSRPGAVFTMTDDPVHNAVLSYERSADGTLEPAGSTETGGAGSGGGEGILGSQGAVVLTGDGRHLLVVNAGSDEVSAFRVHGAELELTGRAPSGGALPVSVTVHEDLVYVVNAGGDGEAASLSGLRLGEDGTLAPLPGSTRALSTATAGPGQISFDPSGELLVVTEKATQSITLYRVDGDGLPSVFPEVVPSAGRTPFGFAFTRRDDLLVSEAQGGEAGASTTSSYRLHDFALELTSASVPNDQSAACWLVVTSNGHHAFVGNAGSGSLSSYRVDGRGGLTLLDGAAAVIEGGRPFDLALTANDRYLYALDAANHAITVFGVNGDGSLTALPAQASGLPESTVGLAAR